MEEFDYIIVGAGSAGCVLANRLSVDTDRRVLVLEAGGADRDPLIHIPLGLGRMHERRSHDWGYDVEPASGLNGRALEAMRGKVLGGSSSINHMAHVRGNSGDYDRWAMSGLSAWSYANVLPYFRRCETWEGGSDDYRGDSGPLSVIFSRNRDPLLDAFSEAAEAAGVGRTPDYNGARQEGIGRGQFTIANGRRHSAASAYLRPVLGRRNLTVRTHAHVLRITMRGCRATGVAYRHRDRIESATAAREVIVCGGAFNSPQLLMNSGIGPADELRTHGVDPILDLRGVGRNLQDHLSVMVSASRPVAGQFRREMRADRMLVNLTQAYLFGSGPATSLPGGLHAFIKTAANLDAPDLQILFRAVSSKPHLWFPGIRKPYVDQCGVRPVLLHPSSRGQVLLRSSDPREPVRILSNFLTTRHDIETLRYGVELAREFLGHPSLAEFRGAEIAPGSEIRDRVSIEQWIRRTAVTVHHPCGTCAMGIGENAVLDPELKVWGAVGLRVVDASAMPDLVSGNINACVLMIAEKASDLILNGPAPAAPAADVRSERRPA